MGVVRRPEPGIGDGQPEDARGVGALGHRYRSPVVRRDLPVGIQQFDPNLRRWGGGRVQGIPSRDDADFGRLFADPRHDEDVVDPMFGGGFDPDFAVKAAPLDEEEIEGVDAAHEGVDVGVSSGIDANGDDGGVSGADEARDVEAEGDDVADVGAGGLSVDPDLGGAVRAAEGEPDSARGPVGGDGDGPAVPAGSGKDMEQLVGFGSGPGDGRADGGRGVGGEVDLGFEADALGVPSTGDLDPAGKGGPAVEPPSGDAFVARIEAEFPGAREFDPGAIERDGGEGERADESEGEEEDEDAEGRDLTRRRGDAEEGRDLARRRGDAEERRDLTRRRGGAEERRDLTRRRGGAESRIAGEGRSFLRGLRVSV
jgi:hypothetical protein